MKYKTIMKLINIYLKDTKYKTIMKLIALANIYLIHMKYKTIVNKYIFESYEI